jgi:hypothetical protein
MSLLVHEFLAKHEATVFPQSPYSPNLVPADFFIVPEVKIHSERSLIGDERRDRWKFALGPMRYPAKCISELEEPLEAAYGQWEKYFEGDESC